LELEVWIQQSDRNLLNDLFESEEHRQKVISDGVTIKYKSRYATDAIDHPTWVIVVIEIAKNVGFPVASTLIANYLWKKLQDRKESKFMIERNPVEINVEKIKQFTLYMMQNKEDKQKNKE